MAGAKRAKTYHFHPEWEEDYFFVYSHSKPVCLICNATVALAKKGNVARHFKTVHGSYERDFPTKTPLRTTKVQDLKAQLASRQSICTKPKTQEGSMRTINSTEQMNGSADQTKEVKKEEEPTGLPQEVQGSNWSDRHHSPSSNSTSHNAELQGVAYPAAFSTAPDSSRVISQHLHPSSTETGVAGRRWAQHENIDLSRTEHQQRTEALEQQMRIQEWENRLKVLVGEQELVREKRRAVQQKEKAFRMKKAYYKAKLKRMGEDVPPSSSSSEEEETMSNTTG